MIKIWQKLTASWNYSLVAALILLILGLGIIERGFNFLYAGTDTFGTRQFIADLYANGGAELLSIALTVLIIESLNERRAAKERRNELIYDLGSDESITTKAAIRMLRLKGWLTDGSLSGANLADVNLRGLYLELANLQGVNFEDANLQDADLTGAKMQGANLQYANLENTNLTDVEFDTKTTLPDETRWTADSDMKRFTDKNHPQFWQPVWASLGFYSWRDWYNAGKPSSAN